MNGLVRRIYAFVRRVFPLSLKVKLSQLVFAYSGKPFVRKDKVVREKKFPKGERGGLVISADFEMAWAWRYTKTGADHIRKGQVERYNIPTIIKLLDQYKVPITFATVGHLFLTSCKKGDHDWMRRIPHFDDHWKFTHGDWYDHDPYANYKDTPEWYAPDLIKMILDAEVKHEVATHTFSHIDFSDKNCPPEVADDEIRACVEAAKPYKLSLKSIVFPGGTWGNITVLKKHGIQIYRKNEDFDLAYPYRDEHGLLVTNSSGTLEYNLAYGWTPAYYLKRLKKYIDKAVSTGTIAHLWFHPSLDPSILETVFPAFFSYVDKKRQDGDLWIGTMDEIAEYINENKIV